MNIRPLSAATACTVLAAISSISSVAFAQGAGDIVVPAPIGEAASTIYRQVTPDGRIIYSDKAVKGARIDQTLKVETPIKGNLWTTDSNGRPNIPPQTARTEVSKVNAIPQPGQKKTADDASADVIRAEMLLEDAKARQQAGNEPQAGERTGNAGGGSRLNPAYETRQKKLAQDVAEAEANLRKAVAERDAVGRSR
jgi:hypothetical protein